MIIISTFTICITIISTFVIKNTTTIIIIIIITIQCRSNELLIGGAWLVILSNEQKNVLVMLVFDYRLIVLLIGFFLTF